MFKKQQPHDFNLEFNPFTEFKSKIPQGLDQFIQILSLHQLSKPLCIACSNTCWVWGGGRFCEATVYHTVYTVYHIHACVEHHMDGDQRLARPMI